MQPGISTGDVRVTSVQPYGVTGETLDIRGQQFVSLTLEGQEYRHPFLVCPLPTDAVGLFGTEFFEKTGAEINFECGKMSLTDIDQVSRVYSIPPVEHTSLTVFAEGKVRRSSQLSKQETRHTDEQFLSSFQQVMWRVPHRWQRENPMFSSIGTSWISLLHPQFSKVWSMLWDEFPVTSFIG